MKVAVISNLETQQGRSCFIVLLASVFSRSQRKRSSIYSTGDMKNLLSSVEVKTTQTSAKSVSVFRAMLDAATIKDDEIYDYANRIGDEEVFAFNLLDSSFERDELEELFITTMNKDRSDLRLFEIVGPLDNPFNQKVLQNVDAVINIFNHNTASIDAVRDYVENYDKNIVRRTGFVCQKYDANVVGEKKLGHLIKMNARNFIVLPYNPIVGKEAIDGTLNTLARYIVTGHNEVVGLRSKLLEVMQFLFDSPKHKYIRGVSEWHK